MFGILKADGVSEVLGLRLMQAKPCDMMRCEKMYSSQWRTAPFLASTLDTESFEELESDLHFESASKQLGTKPSATADEWAIECWYERVGEIASSLPPTITEETLLVELMNYKGEGEGLAVFDSVKHLPVFVSKLHSAELFNC